MRRSVVAVAAGCCVLLTACSSSQGAGGGAPAAAAGSSAAVNPVTILRKITGCTLSAGETTGNRSGSVRYADCLIPDPDPAASDGDQITVYTAATPADLASELATQGGSSTDNMKIITGDGFFLTDTGEYDVNSPSGGTIFITDPATVAAELGGKVT